MRLDFAKIISKYHNFSGKISSFSANAGYWTRPCDVKRLNISPSKDIHNSQVHRMLKNEIEIPEGVSVSFANGRLDVKGKKGESAKEFVHPMISLAVDAKNSHNFR